jgi:predicted O-methyltransferase YrrM
VDLPGTAVDVDERGRFTVDGVDFVLSDMFPAGGKDAFSLLKPRSAIDAHLDLLQRYDHSTIVELCIAYGGSSALLCLVAQPAKLVAIDYAEARVEQLDRFIEERGLANVARTFYGVDQADRARLSAILDAELGRDPVDLVIDDASHQYGPALASFEVLFPRVRPGGEYVIEDWWADHWIARRIADGLADRGSEDHEWATKLMTVAPQDVKPGQRPLGSIAAELMGGPVVHPGEPPRPLSRLAFELVHAKAEQVGVVDSVAVDDHRLVVRRGRGDLDPATFRLSGMSVDRFGQLP